MDVEPDGVPLFVSIMPWGGLQQEVRIGKTTFWPWRKTEDRVTDAATRETIQGYVSCFVDTAGQPVDTAMVCSHEGKDFKCPTDNEWDDIRCARDALVFSVICPEVVRSIKGCSIGLCSAERFQAIGQGLRPGETTLCVRSGYNLTLGQFKLHRPLSVGTGYLAQPEPTIIDAIDKALSDSFPRDVRTRVFRSFEWFRLAHVEADQVSEASKVVMMATAFETLLGISMNDKAKSVFFAKQVEARFQTEESEYATRTCKKQDHKYTKAAWWAYDFYKLRNRIVHGDQVGSADLRYNGHVSQKDVADAVFYQILFEMLYDNGCVDCPAILSHLASEERKGCLLVLEGFEATQEALGWVRTKEA